MARLTIRIEFENGRALGPGKIRLLELIEKVGSIRGAAIAMEMSYRRAWLLIHEIEAMMKASAITAETGGSKGGGTKLTAVGRDIVDRYRALETGAAQAVGAELRALAKMTSSSVKPRGSAARPKRSAGRHTDSA